MDGIICICGNPLTRSNVMNHGQCMVNTRKRLKTIQANIINIPHGSKEARKTACEKMWNDIEDILTPK